MAIKRAVGRPAKVDYRLMMKIVAALQHSASVADAIDVCSRAAELFDAKTSKLEQKRYLLSFILSNMTLEGEKLHFTLKEPFEDVIELSKTQNWWLSTRKLEPILQRNECKTKLALVLPNKAANSY